MALSFPLIALLIWTIALHMQIKDDQSVIIAVEGYDPRDLLRGHYVNLSLYWDATDMTQFQNSNCRQADFKKTYRYYLDEKDGPGLYVKNGGKSSSQDYKKYYNQFTTNLFWRTAYACGYDTDKQRKHQDKKSNKRQ